jgi:IS605 OrfB family transposase
MKRVVIRGADLVEEQHTPYNLGMKLTLQLKLLPTVDQAAALLDTMRRFNTAATFAARQAFKAGVFSKPSIQKLAYRACRERFGLSAQMAVRAIAKATECFSRDKTICPVFRPDGAMTYDERILSFKDCHRVSILAVGAGRLMVPYVFGEYQAANLARIRGQCDLVSRDGMFFLYCTIEFQETPPVGVSDFLGIDLGIANIATDSTGEAFSGEKVDRNRRRRETARKQYQRRGTKNAKRRLKKMAGRQRRFQAAENHRISKRIVAKAKALGFGIALEDLSGIRSRIEDTVGRRFRRRFGNWSFSQLRLFIEYKARREGVPVAVVNPLNSSRTCSACGHCDKGNRKDQASFRCLHCGHSLNADHNAALNLRAWAARKPAPKATA